VEELKDAMLLLVPLMEPVGEIKQKLREKK
jgi:hypothetical protein